MKSILSLALMFGLGGIAFAADAVNPVGTWNCEYEIAGQKMTLTITIKKDGDKLVGTMSWPDQKDEKLKNLKQKEKTLTFSNVRKYMDNEYPLDFTLTIDGDTIKGKATVDVGGQKQDYELGGQREKKGK